jgi:PAS domain S-box-containing protein
MSNSPKPVLHFALNQRAPREKWARAPKGSMNYPAAHPETGASATADLGRYRLQDLLGQAPAGIGLLSGPEQRWIYVNDYYVRMTGRTSAADFIGKTIRESLPEIESQGFNELREKVYRTGEPYVGREMMAKLNRSAAGLPDEGYFDFVYQPLRDPEGKVEGILIHAVEVTDKVAARKRIEDAAERLELAQAAARIGTWEWDPAQEIHELSPELHRIFGTDESDPNHARQWASRVHPDDWPKVQQLMLEGHRLGKMEFEYRYQHPALGLRWFYCIGRKLRGQTPMFGAVQDITARKAAEEASQRLAAIVESSDDAIISKDLNGIVTSWNPCAQKIFGYTAAEMIGRPILTIIPPELHATESEILATIARGERIEHFETVRLRKDGERIEISLTVSPVKDETGRIVGAAKIARDITQLRKAERALRTTERLASVGRLAATVAHEINNPLEAVTNLIYLARQAAILTDVQGYLDAAEQELARVSQLTKQTLGFYRETKSASNVRPGDLVTSLLPVFASRTRNRGIELCPEIEDDSEIYAVAGEIRQVIANLIGNSIDALTAGGKVRIRVSAATQWSPDRKPGIRLTVSDTGSGIPPEARPKIFEPFFTTKRDVGTGLGLWVCKSIVENHGGSIRVKSSTAPGKSWTVVSVFLPSTPRSVVAPDVLAQAAQRPDVLRPAI